MVQWSHSEQLTASTSNLCASDSTESGISMVGQDMVALGDIDDNYIPESATLS